MSFEMQKFLKPFGFRNLFFCAIVFLLTPAGSVVLIRTFALIIHLRVATAHIAITAALREESIEWKIKTSENITR